MSTTFPTAVPMANIAAAAIGLPVPLVRLALSGLVIISGGGLVVISGSLVVVTGGLVVGGWRLWWSQGRAFEHDSHQRV